MSSKLKLRGNLFLAPMARITDIAFRSLCVDYGADVTCTELISADGIIRDNDNTKKLIERAENERQFAIQLFGSDPEIMSKAARKIADQCTMIDVNMGCPVPKVYKQKAGSALLTDPKRASAIVKQMCDEVDKPITVKMRIGINEHNKNYTNFAQRLEEAGAKLIMVHGRTQVQGYRGHADWQAIQEIKEQAQIPIIGNGDITSAEDAKRRLEETKVDGIAIGRKASGNPVLFSETKELLKTGSYTPQGMKERLTAFLEYLRLARTWNTHFLHQKMQAQEFTKGIYGASTLRLQLNDAKTSEELEKIVGSAIEERTRKLSQEWMKQDEDQQ